ncbi:MAG TPA: hypothetical protein VG269_01555 [Tepidisphaeraceae bacterium]|nr:hypothetical protein [Tepidisphaeraceae bacterium]
MRSDHFHPWLPEKIYQPPSNFPRGNPLANDQGTNVKEQRRAEILSDPLLNNQNSAPMDFGGFTGPTSGDVLPPSKINGPSDIGSVGPAQTESDSRRPDPTPNTADPASQQGQERSYLAGVIDTLRDALPSVSKDTAEEGLKEAVDAGSDMVRKTDFEQKTLGEATEEELEDKLMGSVKTAMQDAQDWLFTGNGAAQKTGIERQQSDIDRDARNLPPNALDREFRSTFSQKVLDYFSNVAQEMTDHKSPDNANGLVPR